MNAAGQVALMTLAAAAMAWIGLAATREEPQRAAAGDDELATFRAAQASLRARIAGEARR